ncbi:uncharacterized protein LOC112514086 [Cynara cardunculus var. scolymus]|uniref:uncharacterized protein LOC112514086 n=1 Tax=Cynara cardunculus var. scolymus TaxID=59895 RepID=UPI000D62CDD0|nr:uncharacterized protein LOC112514086 [Cynara cardunculus var. scolymus]
MINIKVFDSWMLQIRNDTAYDDVTNELLKLPAGIFPETVGNPIESVVEMIYHSLLKNCNSPSYITERVILMPKNDMVQELNTFIMDMLPGEGKTYLSSDTICKGSVQTNDEDLIYPTDLKEFAIQWRSKSRDSAKGRIPNYVITQHQSNRRIAQWNTIVCHITWYMVFTHGQLCVAISRVTSHEGLTIIKADEEMEHHTLIKNIVYHEVFNNIHPSTE